MTETRATYHVGDPGDETTPRADITVDAEGWAQGPGYLPTRRARLGDEHAGGLEIEDCMMPSGRARLTAVGMAPTQAEMAAAIQRLAVEHHKRERLLGKESVPHRDLMRANQCVEAAYDSLLALAARLPRGR